MKRTTKRNLAIAALLSATTSIAWAASHSDGFEGRKHCNPEHRGAMMKHHGGFFGKGMNRQAMLEREFNKGEIRTLMQAKLLMKGNENLKVGEITKTKTGFNVEIVTNEDSLVDTWELAPNGMRMEMFQRIQKHMEKRDDS